MNESDALLQVLASQRNAALDALAQSNAKLIAMQAENAGLLAQVGAADRAGTSTTIPSE